MMFFFDEDRDEEDYEHYLLECSRMESDRAEAIAAAIKNNPCHHFDGLGDYVVGRHVTVCEIIDSLGESHLIAIPSDKLRRWEAVGMLKALG